jgi:hypothetical protein
LKSARSCQKKGERLTSQRRPRACSSFGSWITILLCRLPVAANAAS